MDKISKCNKFEDTELGDKGKKGGVISTGCGADGISSPFRFDLWSSDGIMT